MQRTLALELKNKVLSFRYKYHKPTWHTFPRSIQLNTHNYCNLACVYCNVKQDGAYKKPRGKMETKIFYNLLEALEPYSRYVEVISTFMNGEPLLEPRLEEFNDELLRHPYSNVLDSNGTLPDKAPLLIHPAVRTIRISLSADNPELYKKIHGVDYFNEVNETLEYLKKHKLRHQNLQINHMICKQNQHRLKHFIQKYRNYDITVFPLHSGPLQENSIKHDTDLLDEPQKYKDGRNRGSIWDRSLKYKPCQCWDLQGIGKHGEIMHCVDYPEEYNYGTIYNRDLKEAWQLKQRTYTTHELCRSCSLNKGMRK